MRGLKLHPAGFHCPGSLHSLEMKTHRAATATATATAIAAAAAALGDLNYITVPSLPQNLSKQS